MGCLQGAARGERARSAAVGLGEQQDLQGEVGAQATRQEPRATTVAVGGVQGRVGGHRVLSLSPCPVTLCRGRAGVDPHLGGMRGVRGAGATLPSA